MDPSAFIQEYYRIRSGDTVGLNTDSGWAAAENTDATIGTGVEFRIRFKVRETAAGNDNAGFKLQVNRNSGGWVDVDVLGGTSAPATQAVISSQFADGDATSTELLSSTTTYVNGEGLEDNNSGSYSLTSEEAEFEWCLQIMSLHDGPAQNVASDTLDFRVVESDGTVFTGTYTNPTITVSETAGYIGGAFIETPDYVGPVIDTNGNIYFLIEHAETENAATIIKSTDGGDTWRPIDHANRPTNGDMEGMSLFQDGDTLHIGHVRSQVFYHSFRMSDHGTNPDTWDITDESVDSTITSFTTQYSSIHKRSDGTIVLFYVDGGSPMRCYYKIRNGSWGSRNTVDSEASTDFISPSSVLGASNKIHLIYKDETNGIIYHRSLSSGDSLSGRETIATGVSTSISGDNAPFCPPVYYDSSGNEKILIAYKKSWADAGFYRIITNDGAPSSELGLADNDIQWSQGGSHQMTACLAVDGTNVHLLYCHDTENDMYRTSNDDDAGWVTDVEEIDGVDVDWVRSAVITHSAGNGGAKVLAYIWDNGSDGGTGKAWYGEYALAVAPVEVSVSLARVAALSGPADAVAEGSLPLSRIAAQAAAGDALAEALTALNRSSGLASIAGLILEESVSLARVLGLTGAADAVAEGALPLARSVSLAAGAIATAEGAVALNRIDALVAQASATGDGLVSLSRVAALIIAADATAEGGLTLTRIDTLAIVADIGRAVALVLNRVNALAAAADATAEAMLILNKIDTLATGADATAEATLALSRIGALIAVTGIAVEAALALSKIDALTTIAAATAEVAVPLNRINVFAGAADAIAEAGLSLSRVSALISGGVANKLVSLLLDRILATALVGGGVADAGLGLMRSAGIIALGTGDVFVSVALPRVALVDSGRNVSALALLLLDRTLVIVSVGTVGAGITEVSLGLARGAGVVMLGNATFLSGLTLTRNAGITALGAENVLVSMILSRIIGVDSGGVADVPVSTLLSRVLAIALVGSAEAEAGLSLARNIEIIALGDANALSGLTLNRGEGILSSANSAIDSGLVLARDTGIVTLGTGNVLAGIVLPRVAEVGSGGIAVALISLLLGRQSVISPAGSADAQAQFLLAQSLILMIRALSIGEVTDDNTLRVGRADNTLRVGRADNTLRVGRADNILRVK